MCMQLKSFLNLNITPGPYIPYFVNVSAVSVFGEGDVTTVLNFTQEGG